MFAKFWLLWVYVSSLFNMVVINSIKHPENIPYIFEAPEVWLYPEIQRGWNLVTGKEVPYQDEKDVLESYQRGSEP